MALSGMRRTSTLPAIVSFAALPVLAEEPKSALQFSLDYTAEAWTTLEGTASSGSAYLDNLDAVLEADLEALAGWNDTRVVVYALYNNGKEFGGRYIGDLQGVSNIETGVDAARLFEAFVETGIGSRGSLLVGLYDLNSGFDALDSSSLFIHSAHGIGTEIAQTGVNGPSIFPVTSLAARLEYRWGGGWLTRAAVLDAVPGDPEHPARTRIDLGDGEGALLVAEAERRTGGGKLLGGAWRYTAAFPDRLQSAQAGTAREERGNHGLYARGEWRSGTWSYFARLGWAAPRFNVTEWYAGAGAVYEGGWTLRDGDRVGLAFALAEVSDRYRAALALSGETVASRELAVELTYEMPLGERLVLQPDLQYIVNPGLSPSAGNAWAVGLRAVLSVR